MRVFPTGGITAPRLPFEKLYSLFIVPSLLRCRLTNRNDPSIVIPRCPDDHHRHAECVCPQGHKAMLSLSRIIFDRDCQGITQNAISFGKRDTMLLESFCILLGIKSCCH